MDIDRNNFWGQLPTILQAICDSQYVAVNIVTSGIAVHDEYHSKLRSTKPTLQKEYKIARDAAESYTILQLGLTCINWDHGQRCYVTKSFNMILHPGVVISGFFSSCLCKTVDRDIHMSDKCLNFLEAKGLKFSDVFKKGVPYLSVEESSSEKVSEFISSGKTTNEESLLDIYDLPQASSEFRNGLKEKISTWRAQLLSGALTAPCRVANPSGGGHRLNKLQKHIAHQLIQDRFSDLICQNRDRGHHLVVQKSDPNDRFVLRDSRRRTKIVNQQVGARLLWDAIRGQPFAHKIDLELVVGADVAKCDELKARLEGFETRVRKRSLVLIGHNMLRDLCFLHSTFVGNLPESVQEFREVTRAELPRIVDIKYLFTRVGDEMSPDYNLNQCADGMKRKKLPRVVPSPSYHYRNPLSSAGYDSYRTATVFLRKAYQLAQTGEHLGHFASDDPGEEDTTRIATPGPAPHSGLLEDHGQGEVAALAGRTILEPHRSSSAPPLGSPTSECGSKSPFEIVRSSSAPPMVSPTSECGSKSPSEIVDGRTIPEPHRSSSASPTAGLSETVAMIPEWGGRFWDTYGNTFKVGPLGLVLCMSKMAGEEMAGEEMAGEEMAGEEE